MLQNGNNSCYQVTLPVDVTTTSNQETSYWLVTILDCAMEEGLGTTIRTQIPSVCVAAIFNLATNQSESVCIHSVFQDSNVYGKLRCGSEKNT